MCNVSATQVLKSIVKNGNVTLDEVLVIVSLEEALLLELNKLVEVVEKVNLSQGHVDGSEQNLKYLLDLSAMNQVSMSARTVASLDFENIFIMVKCAACFQPMQF